MDVKQESAMRAATDAEADIKCATLYDQTSTTTATATATAMLTTEEISAPEFF